MTLLSNENNYISRTLKYIFGTRFRQNGWLCVGEEYLKEENIGRQKVILKKHGGCGSGGSFWQQRVLIYVIKFEFFLIRHYC